MLGKGVPAATGHDYAELADRLRSVARSTYDEAGGTRPYPTGESRSEV